MQNPREQFMNNFKNLGTKLGEKSFPEKKSQENDSQTLLDSQEDVFRKLSAVFSQSSHSTNIGDLEETLVQEAGMVNVTKGIDLGESPLPVTYNLRPRTVAKLSENELHKQTSDYSKNLKLIKKQSREGKFAEKRCEQFPPVENLEDSQESVSMLQECYQKTSKNEFPDLMETCTNSELEVIDIYSDEEMDVPVEDEHIEDKVEISTQTEFLASQPELNHPKEREMAKHANFISSVIKLKAALSSKKTISDKKLRAILQKNVSEDDDMGMDETQQILPKETIGYLLRSSDMENVFRETVQLLLQQLKGVLKKDFTNMAYYWKNSVYENIVEMLSQAVSIEVGVWKMVATFLCTIIDSILNDKSKNWILESKTNFIITFCQSTRLSYSIVNFILEKLKTLTTIQRPNESSNKLSSVFLTNNSYFLLRILEHGLEFLKCKVSEEAIEAVLIKKPQGKNYNVLKMWKKHWNRNEILEEQKTGHECEATVSGWCDILDEILLHCVNHIPVLSMVVERCGELAKEILKLCHSSVPQENV